MKYTVKNPILKGTIDVEYDANTPIEAAKQFWVNFSKELSENVAVFYYLLSDENNKLFHFVVNEQPDQNMANFEISELNSSKIVGNVNEILEKFTKSVEKGQRKMNKRENKQAGGHKHKHRRRRYKDDDDDSSSSDSSDDDIWHYTRIRRHLHPLSYMFYTPSLYKIDSISMPVSVSPFTTQILFY